ncbi:hypothetical protein CGRA01v4_14031 [Colletotrichum graminicola]|nr:hypothetical protein CGRA01v4_14031 [Colletotrichum graminicola]
MRLSTIQLLATSIAGVIALDVCTETTPRGGAITGFNYITACNTWAWIGWDDNVDISIQSDCTIRQNWPNDQGVSYVCIQISRDTSVAGAVQNKCFVAPDAKVINSTCLIPQTHCPGIVNAWGWPRAQ